MGHERINEVLQIKDPKNGSKFKRLLNEPNVATPEPSPTRLASLNRNPVDARLIHFILRFIMFSFQKCHDPNPWPDPNGGSEPKPGLLRRFHLS